jgi:glycosyltransferase involved in cell wall biosynthesis
MVIPEKISQSNAKLLHDGTKFILKHADYLVAVSETTKRELIHHCGIIPERIYVVTHGVDKYFRRRNNQSAVWDHLKATYDLKNPFILYVGGIAVHKNVMGILAAYKIISGTIHHDLVMVGPKDTAWSYAHRYVQDNGLSERVRFIGNVDQSGDNLMNFYNGSDLFVFPSFYEAWTSPPLEAMACGTPVITSNCSSLPETVGNAAILVDPNNTEALAYEMKRVLSNKELQKELIEKGFVHVSSHTWEKAAQKMVDVFTDVMARGPWEKR